MLSFGAYSRQMVKEGTTDNISVSADQFKQENEIKTGNVFRANTYHESTMNEEDMQDMQEATQEDFQINLQVSDAEQVWSRTTEINLFDSHYINEEGNESVRSEDNQKVIAPGTQSQYLFHVTNQGTQPIRYQIWYETVEKASGFYLPIEAEMKKLCVNESGTSVEKETTDSQLKIDQTTEFLLQPESFDTYQFQWKWLYERGDDLYDTQLGNLAVNQNLEYFVKIHVRAEIDLQGQLQNGHNQSEPEQSKSSQEQSGKRMRTGIKTGDAAKWRYWCMVCAISLMFSILLYGGLKWLGYGTATVMSGSMEPKLKVGDLVILEPVNRKASLKAGDIIVYRSGKKRIVHRLVSVSKNTLRVKGDANNQEDKPIRFQQVEGRVLCRIPKAGKLFSSYRKSRGTSEEEKAVYGAFCNWSGQQDQASVAGFDIQVEGKSDSNLILDDQTGTDVVSYSFSVTSHSQVDVEYQIFLEFEDGVELPDGVSYEITPEQGWIQAGDVIPKEHTVSFYFKSTVIDCGETEAEENRSEETDVNLAEERQERENEGKQSEEEQCKMTDETLLEKMSDLKKEEDETETIQMQEETKGETEDAMKEIQNMIIKHIKIRMVAEQAE